MSIPNVAANAAAVKPRLQELGDALDIAEATDPILRPRDCHEAFAERPLAPFEYALSKSRAATYVWIPPHHPAVRAYWRELKADILLHPYVEDDLRHCRKRYRLAWARYDDMTVRRDSGAFPITDETPSLRAILDARAELVEAFTILEQVTAATKYQRDIAAAKRRTDHNAKLHQNGRALVRAIKQTINRVHA
jgi:hypothetical protein